MDYAEARAAFFQPRAPEDTGDRLDGWQSPARRLRDAIEPLATVCYWSEPSNVRYTKLGLDFLTGYVWSRACVLGEPDAGVVASAFAVFEPGLVAQLYDAARAACSLADIRRARLEGAIEALRGSGVEPGDTADILARAVRAADPTGRPLFSGARSLPEPDDPLGRLFSVCAALREYRGDSHTAAYLSAGLTGLEANVLTERRVGWAPHSYTATRGWAPEAMDATTAELTKRGLLDDGELTEAGQKLRDEIEGRTDAQMQPLLDAVGADVDRAIDQADAAAQRVLDRGWFPPDPYKRASG